MVELKYWSVHIMCANRKLIKCMILYPRRPNHNIAAGLSMKQLGINPKMRLSEGLQENASLLKLHRHGYTIVDIIEG